MILHRRTNLLIGLIIFTGILTVGCDQTEELVESQDQHVCEHLTYGPPNVLDAATSIQSAKDSLVVDDQYRVQAQLHARYDIHLNVDGTGLYSGFVPYKAVADQGDYILYMDKSVGVTVFNTVSPDSILLPEEVMDHSDDCDAVAYRGVFELDPDDSYILAFEGESEAIIGVLFPKAEDSDESHDH